GDRGATAAANASGAVEGNVPKSNRAGECGLGFVVAAEHHQGDPPVGVAGGIHWVAMDDPIKITERLARSTQPEVAPPALDEGLDVIGMALKHDIQPGDGLGVLARLVERETLAAIVVGRAARGRNDKSEDDRQ